MKHKHAEEIHAFAEGYKIQKLVTLCCDRSIKHWEDMEVSPMWHEDEEYRVKPYNEQWEEDDE